MNVLPILSRRLDVGGRTILAGVPHGFDAIVLADIARALGDRVLVHVTTDDQRMASLGEALAFFAPDVATAWFPAWDCLPYDRVSPVADIVAGRLATLSGLASHRPSPLILLTTVNAALQRVPTREVIANAVFSASPGRRVDTEALITFLGENGFSRTGTVVDPGDFAVRGGIIDIYPPGAELPVRLDFFGDTLESVRSFDPLTQRSTGKLEEAALRPVSEVLLDDDAVRRFRSHYREQFGATGTDDPLYESVSAGRRYPGMEHWLPLYYERLETLFDYLPGAGISLDYQAEEVRGHRLEAIGELHRDSFRQRDRLVAAESLPAGASAKRLTSSPGSPCRRPR